MNRWRKSVENYRPTLLLLARTALLPKPNDR